MTDQKADTAPPVDDYVPPITTKGEPRKSPPRGGRPRLSESERAERAATAAEGKANGTRVNPEVTQALAVMNTAYSLITTGLMMLGAHNAAAELSSKIPAVQDQNRQFLQADPKLAQRIAKIGSSTGRAGFLITNLGLLTAVAVTASAEISFGKSPTVKVPTAPTQETQTSQPVFDEPHETPAQAPIFPFGN